MLLAALLALLSPTDDDVLGELKGATHLRTTYTIKQVDGQGPTYHVRLEWRRPDRLMMEVGATKPSRYFQSGSTLVAYDAVADQYMQLEGPIPSVIPPPGPLSPFGGLAPSLLFDAYHGLTLNTDQSVATTRDGTEWRLARRPDGSLVSATWTAAGMMGPVEYIVDFQSMTTDAFVPDEEKYRIPLGSTPSTAPIVRPLLPGVSAPLQTLGKAYAGKGAVAVVFTAADCPASDEIQPSLTVLRTKLADFKAGMVQVRLGGQADPDNPYGILDKDGLLEREWRPPVTPYIFIVGEDGKIQRAWSGYRPGEQKAMLDHLLKDFRDAAASGH